jgi:hypothetical protein
VLDAKMTIMEGSMGGPGWSLGEVLSGGRSNLTVRELRKCCHCSMNSFEPALAMVPFDQWIYLIGAENFPSSMLILDLLWAKRF